MTAIEVVLERNGTSGPLLSSLSGVALFNSPWSTTLNVLLQPLHRPERDYHPTLQRPAAHILRAYSPFLLLFLLIASQRTNMLRTELTAVAADGGDKPAAFGVPLL